MKNVRSSNIPGAMRGIILGFVCLFLPRFDEENPSNLEIFMALTLIAIVIILTGIFAPLMSG